MKSAHFFLLFLSLFCLLASATKSMDHATCEHADWYEIGRRDGSQGFPNERLVQHQRECVKHLTGNWDSMYANGRNAGLVEYCENKNAYDLGRAGVPYYYVCPSTVEAQFLTSYRRGQSARVIEIENQHLDQQITDLALKLTHSTNVYEQRQISVRLKKLRNLRTKNESTLGQIIVK